MTIDRFQQAERIFHAARSQSADAQRSYVDQQCAGDEELRALVLGLLRHDERPVVTLEASPGAAVRALADTLFDPAAGDAPLPPMIGPYRVLERLGQGGFGVVYLAQQDNPRRTVAIKVLRSTAATPELMRRFDYEIAVLGRLQHPGIAQIFAAGVAEFTLGTDEPARRRAAGDTSPAGRMLARTQPRVVTLPYYAMEYIHGRNLIEFADAPASGRGPLAVAERVELFARVCDAIQHAHQHGVIHRDLKPENILIVEEGGDAPRTSAAEPAAPARPPGSVTPAPQNAYSAQPKILDFGVARPLEGNEQGGPFQTSVGQMIGTPAYMSPEQVAGDSRRVDTRSDVYALGVLLYRLIAGRLPHAIEGQSLSDVVRAIAERPPPPLRSVSARSTAGPIDADIEAIVFKALAKEPERRYQSASDLAADLRRYAAGEPIEARRDSALYLLRKALRRYRGALTAAGGFVVLLVCFAVWATWQAGVNRSLADAATRSEQMAIAARDEATRTADLLAEELMRNNLERARALALAGNFADAEKLIWRELLRRPESPAARWAALELYSRFPYFGSLPARVGATRVLALSADESTLAVSGTLPGVELWDLRTLRRVVRLAGHSGEIRALQFSPDGRQLLTAAGDDTIFIWDIESRSPARTICGHDGRVYAAAFSPDGRLIASGSDDRTVRLWDAQSGECIALLRGHTSTVTCIRFSPDGRYLASAGWDQTARLWDLEAYEQVETTTGAAAVPFSRACIAKLDGHLDAIVSLAFTADGRTLASVGSMRDRTIRLWNVLDGSCAAVLRASGGTAALAFAPDGATLYAGGWFGLDTWNVASRQRVASTSGKGACAGLALSRDGTRLVAGIGLDVRLLDVRPDAGSLSLGPQSGRTLAFNPTGDQLAISHLDDSVELRSLPDLRVRDAFDPNEHRVAVDERVLRVRAMCFDPSGSVVATVSGRGVLRAWDVASRACIAEIPGVGRTTQQAVAFSPDGRVWAYAGTDYRYSLRDRETGAEIASLPTGSRSEALSICFSPNGSLIATTARDQAVRLWTAAGEPLAVLPVKHTPWGVTFSPDGAKVLCSTWGGTIEVWDVATRAYEQSLEGHAATVWGLQFSAAEPDVFASHSSDGTVRFWHLPEGQNLATFDVCADEEVLAAAVSPHGDWLAAACSSHEIKLWNLSYYDACVAGNLEFQIDRTDPDIAAGLDFDRIRAAILAPAP